MQCLSSKCRVSSLTLTRNFKHIFFKHRGPRLLGYLRHWLVRFGRLVPNRAQIFTYHVLVKWIVSSGCTAADCQGVPMYSPSTSSTLHLSDTVFKLFYLLGSVQGSVATELVTLGAIQIVSQTFGIITVQPNPLPVDAHAILQR